MGHGLENRRLPHPEPQAAGDDAKNVEAFQGTGAFEQIGQTLALPELGTGAGVLGQVPELVVNRQEGQPALVLGKLRLGHPAEVAQFANLLPKLGLVPPQRHSQGFGGLLLGDTKFQPLELGGHPPGEQKHRFGPFLGGKLGKEHREATDDLQAAAFRFDPRQMLGEAFERHNPTL